MRFGFDLLPTCAGLSSAEFKILNSTTDFSLSLCVQDEVGWQERAPRSLAKEPDYAEAAVEAGSTATPKPPLGRLQDVYISVKTTGHYHRARLAVIIKTWFQLAKDQVGENLHQSFTLRLSSRPHFVFILLPVLNFCNLLSANCKFKN